MWFAKLIISQDDYEQKAIYGRFVFGSEFSLGNIYINLVDPVWHIWCKCIQVLKVLIIIIN